MKKRYEFPKNFLWGVATGSYQIEGAWNEDGKSESIWDRMVHTPGKVLDGTTADVGVDFYHRYPEDLQMMADLGHKSFLYTFSWPRIIPNGVGEVNPKGVAYYRDVLSKAKSLGMHTMMVLYHWDLPQVLQDRGGWTNREMVDWFTNYAKVCYREFGDLVDDWITFVEPSSVLHGYDGAGLAPGYNDLSAMLLAGHNLFLSHGSAVKAFRETGLKSRIGIKIWYYDIRPYDPNSDADREAAEMCDLKEHEYYSRPIFKGEYPQKLMDAYKAAGLTMPVIQPGDMELINQPLDFMGFNHYMTFYAKADPAQWPLGYSAHSKRFGDADFEGTPYMWEYDTRSMYNALHSFYDRYQGCVKDIIITESGCASNDWVDLDGSVNDVNRVTFLKSVLMQLHEAIGEGMPITGYHIWSLFDNFEWLMGLSIRFGIVHVNYKTLKRTPKASAYWYADVIKNNALEIECKD